MDELHVSSQRSECSQMEGLAKTQGLKWALLAVVEDNIG